MECGAVAGVGLAGVRQVFEIERILQVKGKPATREVVDGFTSQGPEEEGPTELLAASREH